MTLHFLFINVRGINNDQKVGVIKDYLSSLSPKVDVFVCNIINYEEIMCPGILGYCGEGITFGFLKLAREMRLKVGD